MKWITKDFLNQPKVKKHFSLVFIGFLLGIAFYGYINFSGFQNNTELFFSGLLGIFVAYLVHFSNLPLNKYLPWKKQPGFRLLVGIFIHLIIGLLVVNGILWAYANLLGLNPLFSEDPNDVLIKIGILLFCLALVYNIIYFAFYSYYEYSKGQVLEIKLKRKQTELQLNALKSQLSPHFLFNSMNALSSLFQKDVEKAESFIRSLASSYQYVLDKYESPLVRLEEELSFVDAYCFLIKTRFGDYLHMEVDFPPAVLQSKIPPLTLQMLVENAVKHNVMEPSKPLYVRMDLNGTDIRVSNNKTAERSKLESLKIGLKNIASRYELLTDKSIQVIDDKDFTVRLPLIP